MKLFESIKSYNDKSLLKHNETFVFLVLLGFSLVVTIINPSFLSLENLFDLAHSSAGMAILAIGVFVVLLSGGIDVSFTAVAISAQYIAVKVLVEAGIDSLALSETDFQRLHHCTMNCIFHKHPPFIVLVFHTLI